MQSENLPAQNMDNDGFLQEMSTWSREVAGKLATLNELGPSRNITGRSSSTFAIITWQTARDRQSSRSARRSA